MLCRSNAFYKVAGLLFLAVLLVACSSGASEDPQPGHFSGTTSQGETFGLWVEETDGGLIVSAVQYTVTMEATSFSVTTEMMSPNDRQISIEQGSFSNTTTSGDSTEELSGSFADSTHVTGTLTRTNVHPQGLGTAIGTVSFEAEWVEP